MKNKQLISEVKELKKIAGLLKEYEEGDEDTNDPDYVQDEKEQEYHRAEEEASRTPIFKRGDVLKSKQKGNDRLTAVIVLKAYPDLETALDDRPQDVDFQKAAVDDILAGQGGPVSKDIADKPWYLTWSEDPGTIGEGSDLIFLDPQELLYK